MKNATQGDSEHTLGTLWALYGHAQRSLIEHPENTQTTEQINKQVQKLFNHMSERTHVPDVLLLFSLELCEGQLD